MEKVINVAGRNVRFKATAATTRKYRQRTGRDLLADMTQLSNAAQSPAGISAASLEAFEDLAYTMAKQADPAIPDDPDEWLDQFDMFSIYEVLPQLLELWGASSNTLESPADKKK